MNATITDARFKTSMLNLEPGDIITCVRNGITLHAVVLERRSESGEDALLKLTNFSSILSLRPYSKEIFWDKKFNMLSDTGGRFILLPEEWISTEKEAAKQFLASSYKKETHTRDEKMKAIFEAIQDRNTDFVQTAEVIIEILSQETSLDEVKRFLGYALSCASRKVWIPE